jgi:hypothetical protein
MKKYVSSTFTRRKPLITLIDLLNLKLMVLTKR